jgi:hypothetical protein
MQSLAFANTAKLYKTTCRMHRLSFDCLESLVGIKPDQPVQLVQWIRYNDWLGLGIDFDDWPHSKLKRNLSLPIHYLSGLEKI